MKDRYKLNALVLLTNYYSQNKVSRGLIGPLFRFLSSVASFSQVLLYLPLVQDIAGKECLLALSLLLSTLFAVNATLYLILRNTRLRPFSAFLSFIVVPIAIPILLLLSLNLYSTDPTTRAKNIAASSYSSFSFLWSFLRKTPGWWEWILTSSGPFFTILEGISTLLVIQALSRFSMRRIENSRAPDLLQLVILVLTAIVYVISAWFLWESYDAVPDRLSATLIGVAVTSIVFLSGISFAIGKGNVVETSLMMAYAVFQIFHLSSRPAMYSGGLLKHVFRAPGANGNPPLPPVVLRSLDAVSSLATQTLGAGVEFVSAASSALPFPVLVGLFYRVAVLYAASRIIWQLKRANEGYVDTKKLSEEEPAARLMTVLVTYSRLVLIAVYTHLLLINSSGSQTFQLWRWLNVFLTTGLWAIELRIGSAEDGRFKSD